jgi:hypothetical protein
MAPRPRVRLALGALLALAASGCLLLSGQFVVTYDFAAHGYDPITVNSSLAVVGVPVDLNQVSEYKDHKKDLKDVSDLALVGAITNLDGSASTDVEVWMVASPGSSPLTTDASVRSSGVRIWGPLHLAPNETRNIGWNDSAQLFSGRAALVDEIRGDGRFDLYALGNNGYHYRVSHAAVIAVIAAGK